jgi:Na+-transporting methylmalonyl-CoA/oxaloacetate decarboxylase gamma subunit
MPPSFIAAVLPYLIGFVVLISGAVYSYRKGWDNRDNLAKTEAAKTEVQAQQQIAQALQAAATTKASNDQHLNLVVSDYEKRLQVAQKNVDVWRRGVDSGAVRVSIAAAADQVCANTILGKADAAAPIGNQTRCELDATTANALIGIAQDGDQAIERLNAIIDFYQGLKP